MSLHDEIRQLKEISDLDRIRLIIEYRTLILDRFKSWSTIASIVIPVVLAAMTISYSIYTQNERARFDFEIKAVEIVMEAESPKAAVHKALVLSEIFPERLPRRFKETLLRMYGDPPLTQQ